MSQRPEPPRPTSRRPNRSVVLGAGIGMIFGAALGYAGTGLVLGAALGLTGVLDRNAEAGDAD